MKLFLGKKHGKKWLILMKTYFLDLNNRNYNRKALWVGTAGSGSHLPEQSDCRNQQFARTVTPTF